MLKAFSVPITPQGKSALATLPPWHYSSDCIAIEYWADPGAIAGPPAARPHAGKKSGGRAFFWFLDWQFTGSNDELTDPARYQYREAFALVEAIFDGVPVNYCPIFLSTTTLRLRAAGRRVSRRSWAAFTRHGASPRRTRPRRRSPREADSVRASRHMESGWRLPDPARGEDRRPFHGLQSPDNDAPVFSATRGRAPNRRWTSSRCR